MLTSSASYMYMAIGLITAITTGITTVYTFVVQEVPGYTEQMIHLARSHKFSVYNMSQIQTFPTNFFKIAKTSLYSLLLGFRKNRLHALTTTKLLYMLMLNIYMYM